VTVFTGIVEDVGAVRSLTPSGGGAVLTVETAIPLAEVSLGDSIAVAGACLTVTARGERTFDADVSAETLSRTTLGRLRPGTAVNLERALTLSGRLGGHLVYGHADGTAAVREVRRSGDSHVFALRAGAPIMRYVVFKGSVALDGVSLTVSLLRGDGFEVTLIPHTLERTTFGRLRAGDEVNVETDIVGKYVERFAGGGGGRGRGPRPAPPQRLRLRGRTPCRCATSRRPSGTCARGAW
jgi:riboflavin synthase